MKKSKIERKIKLKKLKKYENQDKKKSRNIKNKTKNGHWILKKMFEWKKIEKK